MQTAASHPQLKLPILAVTTVFLGAAIGASTNAINGAVSPHYFRRILDWGEVENIWRASIAQGIFEGLIYGIVVSLVFTTVVGCVSKGQCSIQLAFRYLWLIVAAVYACWTIGGIIGVGLAILSPEFYRNTFYHAPEDFNGLLRFAWVGGSIWGALVGSVMSVVITSICFANHWKQMPRLENSPSIP